MKDQRKKFKQSLKKHQGLFWRKYIGTIYKDGIANNEYVYLYSRKVAKHQILDYYYPLYIRSVQTQDDEVWKVKNYYLTHPKQVGIMSRTELKQMLNKEIDLDPNLKKILNNKIQKMY